MSFNSIFFLFSTINPSLPSTFDAKQLFGKKLKIVYEKSKVFTNTWATRFPWIQFVYNQMV
jgi:hypothetical protein